HPGANPVRQAHRSAHASQRRAVYLRSGGGRTMAERERIGMGPEEVSAFLRAKDRLFLGLLEGDGALTGATCNYVYEGDYLYFALPESAPELAAIRADARVCAIVEQVPSYYEIKSVTLHGRAEVLADGQSRSDLLSSPAMDDPAG